MVLLMLHDEYTALAASEDNHWWYKALRVHIISAIKNYVYSRPQYSVIHLFDAGCGTGGLVNYLRTKFSHTFNSIQCCEPNDYARALCSIRNISPLPCAIQDLPATLDNTYDIVTCIDVLYHKHVDPLQALTRLSDITKPGGVVIMNNAALSCFKRSHDDNVLGARRFNYEQVNNLIAASGLRAVQGYYWNTLLAPCLLLSIFLERIKSSSSSRSSQASMPSTLLNRALTIILFLERSLPCNRFFRPFGTSIFSVAVKPTTFA